MTFAAANERFISALMFLLIRIGLSSRHYMRADARDTLPHAAKGIL